MTWEKIKAWFHHSATIAWARFVVFIGGVLAFLDLLAPVLNSYELREALSNVLDPRFVPFIFIAIGIITEIARRRNMSPACALEDDPEGNPEDKPQ